MKDKFYIVDYGKQTAELAEFQINMLKDAGAHVVVYLTDLPSVLMIQEIDQEEFLDHFANSLKEIN